MTRQLKFPDNISMFKLPTELKIVFEKIGPNTLMGSWKTYVSKTTGEKRTIFEVNPNLPGIVKVKDEEEGSTRDEKSGKQCSGTSSKTKMLRVYTHYQLEPFEDSNNDYLYVQDSRQSRNDHWRGKIGTNATLIPLASDKYFNYTSIVSTTTQAPKKLISLEKAIPHIQSARKRLIEIDEEADESRGCPKVREDIKKLEAMLFELFEKFEYYKFNDLVQITQQPRSFLREVLTDIAQYVSTGENRRAWCLKEEYRHYSETS